jgi:uncharacterized Zn-binding protein involved in type VI secretion
MKRKLTGLLIIICLLSAGSLNSFAQEKGPKPEVAKPPTEGTFKVLGPIVAVGKDVKGAPFSATAVTETNQRLSDGNQIIRKNESKLCRDSEGRFRMEQSLETIGKWTAEGEAQQSIFIYDPVAGVSYSLDARTREATKNVNLRREKLADGSSTFKINGKTVTQAEFEAYRETSGKKPPPLAVEGPKPVPAKEGFSIETLADGSRSFKINGQPVTQAEFEAVAEKSGKKPHPLAVEGRKPGTVKEGGNADGRRKTESLGKQMIEGIEVELTRTTLTIPAGDIGNTLPIEVVDETWYSPELQIIVMTRHRDPRSGETTYKLTNLSRSEPDRSLFEVPADYTVRENKMPPKKVRPPQEEQ